MRSFSAGSAVSRYRRWRARSSSRGIGVELSRLPEQVLDHAQVDAPPVGIDVAPEVVHEHPDHLFGQQSHVLVLVVNAPRGYGFLLGDAPPTQIYTLSLRDATALL